MPYSFSFTVTQVVNSFTATVSTPLALALTNVPNSVAVIANSATVSVSNAIQPVTVSGQTGVTSNQTVNTFDNVSFASVTTPIIYGAAGQPVSFPTGINAVNVGTVFTGSLDFGQIFGTYTNILSLLFAAIPLDFGTIAFQPQFSVDLGSI
jgi:hypothetical protein